VADLCYKIKTYRALGSATINGRIKQAAQNP